MDRVIADTQPALLLRCAPQGNACSAWASISRLALWVGKHLMEGEVLEATRAAGIFRSIVEDTVRPRDPALLEWSSQSEVSLKVFPIPAHGTRKVLLAYDQVLAMDGNEATYVYPLSVDAERRQAFDRFELHVTLAESRADACHVNSPGFATKIRTGQRGTEVEFTSANFLPERDFILHYRRKLGNDLDIAQSITTPGVSPKSGAASKPGVQSEPSPTTKPNAPAEFFFVARLDAGGQEGILEQTQTDLERVFLLDTSHSQSKESLQVAARLTLGLLEQMDPNETFAILACDSACRAFPEHGLEPVSPKAVQAARVWVGELMPRGSSDLSAALLSGIQRFSNRGAQKRNAQMIYLGDGAPTAGELGIETISQRIKQTFAAQTMDVRLLGMGSTVDESTLSGLARRLGAVYQRVPLGPELGSKVAKLHLELRQPVLKHARLTASPESADLCPRDLLWSGVGDLPDLTDRRSARSTWDGGTHRPREHSEVRFLSWWRGSDGGYHDGSHRHSRRH